MCGFIVCELLRFGYFTDLGVVYMLCVGFVWYGLLLCCGLLSFLLDCSVLCLFLVVLCLRFVVFHCSGFVGCLYDGILLVVWFLALMFS